MAVQIAMTFPPAIAGGPPPRLGDLEAVSLFVDFDGTLVDLIDNPGEIRVDGALQHLLAELNARLSGRLALVSGRSIAQLDGFLGPLGAMLTLAGSHGVELRRPGGRLIAPGRPSSLDAVERDLARFAAANPGLHVELKSHGAALHYRAAPQHETAAYTFGRDLAKATGLVLQTGKMMVELRGPGDKGDAVRALMRDPPMAGGRPLFVGDDLTDEGGFSAARALGGAGVMVGAPRATAALYRLENVEAVRAWLATAIA
jgi:trehalose 6-phosphate phosphatase